MTYTSKQGGQNALFFAVQKHDLESARILLDAGVDVNLAAADGTTPCWPALKWDPLGTAFVAGKGAPAPAGSSQRFGADLAMARFLLDRGAKVTSPTAPATRRSTGPHWRWRTPSLSADRAGRRLWRRPALLSLGGAGDGAADAGRPGGSADDRAARLLEAGADPNRQTLYPTSGPAGDVRINPAPPGSSAFHIAANSDNLALVKMLADKGAIRIWCAKTATRPFPWLYVDRLDRSSRRWLRAAPT